MNTMTLLHQSGDTILMKPKAVIQILMNYKFQIEKTLYALENFICEKYYLFDPHVGDTACQIRAFKLLSIIKSNKKNIRNDINLIKHQSDKIIHLCDFYHSANKIEKTTVYNLFHTNDLDVEISEESVFLSMSCHLSELKIELENKKFIIDHHKLSLTMCVTRKAAKKLVHHYQKKISEFSIDYILEIIECCQKYKQIKPIIQRSILHDADGRKTLPCYMTMKILLHTTMKFNKFILVNMQIRNNINSKKIIFIYNAIEGDCQLLCKKKHKDIMNIPLIIIDAVAEDLNKNFNSKDVYLQRFNELDLQKLILAYMAAHPQYPSMQRFNFNKQDAQELSHIINEMNEMWIFAIKNGCCEINKGLFFIEHIYCDTPINKMSIEYNEVNRNVAVA